MKFTELLELAYDVTRDSLSDLRESVSDASTQDIARSAANTALAAAGTVLSTRNVFRVAGAVLSVSTLLTGGKAALVIAPARAAMRLATRGLARAAAKATARAEATSGARSFLASGAAKTLRGLSRFLDQADKGLADSDRVFALGANNAAIAGLETAVAGVARGQSLRHAFRSAGAAAWKETTPRRLAESLERTKTRMLATGERAGTAFRNAHSAPDRALRALRRRKNALARGIRLRQRKIQRLQKRITRAPPPRRLATAWRATRPFRHAAARTGLRAGITTFKLGASTALAATRIVTLASLTGVASASSTAPIRVSHIGAVTRRLARQTLPGNPQGAALALARHRGHAPSPAQRNAYWAGYAPPTAAQRRRARQAPEQSTTQTPAPRGHRP